jgi:putative FmdB family regulatory protein
MPVYEFYCIDCHTVFNFLSKTVNTEKRPDCPKCGRKELERKVSLFAFSRGRKEEESADDMPDIDEARLERAMMGLAGEMEGMDENDPKQMASLMRRLKEATGLKLGDGMEEAIRRLENGEDPERIEADMGDLFDEENPFSFDGVKGMRRRYTPPAHDDTLYPL